MRICSWFSRFESLRFAFCQFTLGLLMVAVATSLAQGVTKPHVIVFGKWTTVQSSTDSDPVKPFTLKMRALIVDGRVREYTSGMSHEVTDRLFVVQRVFRLNDSLPEESGAPRWQWQRGGWLLVDRMTARISPISLPEFEANHSDASWYRDFVAYCGVSDDGKKIDAIVAQLGRRKPLLKKSVSTDQPEAASDSICRQPAWQRAPARVSFEPASKGAKQTYAIRGHAIDLVNDTEEDEEEASK
jgi:hypothetical protein